MSDIHTKIQKQTASLQVKIEKLSGSYLTNTWKRQQEQKERDRMIGLHTTYKQVLEYLEEVACERELTILENALVTGAFYETMRVYSVQKKYGEERNLPYPSPRYPDEVSDGWKRLQKVGIINQNELLQAVSAFDELHRYATIPEDPDKKRMRDLIFTARLRQSGDVQFTPQPLAQQLIENVAISYDSRVLEPEAGIGNLADEIKKITPNVDCAEINVDFREVLTLKGYSVLGDSIFEIEQNPVYDAVLMNPPFSEECRHIRYASGFLKPEGTLAAICSPRVTWSDKKEYVNFRAWLSQYPHRIEKVESADFEKTGTGAVILVLDKYDS